MKRKSLLLKLTKKELQEENYQKNAIKKDLEDRQTIDEILKWNYNPSKIEKEVEERPFTEEEKEIIKKVKF